MDESQMLKGILEGCILAVIYKGETYGYEILAILEEKGLLDINEGTLYPILKRLEKKGLIIYRIGESPYGPKRKYFSITKPGEEFLLQWKKAYRELMVAANLIIWGDGE
ncbi:MAG TPA: PadR family transcriptional regulator [Mobilitalea sp.]|nr:PadR family transcriptional regulator [Mobilitalea sp.]